MPTDDRKWNECSWLDDVSDETDEAFEVDYGAYITAGDYVQFREGLPTYLFHSHRISNMGLPSCIRGMKDEDGREVSRSTKYLVLRVVNKGWGVVISIEGREMYFDQSLFRFCSLQ